MANKRTKKASTKKPAAPRVSTVREQVDPHLREYGIAAFARDHDFYQANLSLWLSGQSDITARNLERICDGLDLDIRIVPRRRRRG